MHARTHARTHAQAMAKLRADAAAACDAAAEDHDAMVDALNSEADAHVQLDEAVAAKEELSRRVSELEADLDNMVCKSALAALQEELKARPSVMAPPRPCSHLPTHTRTQARIMHAPKHASGAACAAAIRRRGGKAAD